MTAPRILFVADAGPEVGGGHVMRCLTLANALADRGARPAFVATPAAADILNVFAGSEIGRIESHAEDPLALTHDAAAMIGAFDAVVIDHYHLDAEAHRRIRQGRAALVIDDLADRSLDADLILDSTLGREAGAYAGHVPGDATLLLGPTYALVRPQFAAARSEALQRRGIDAPVKHVLVSMGLTDVGGVTARIVNRILPRLGEAALQVVLGAVAPSHAAVAAVAGRDPRVRVLSDVTDMAALMRDADLAVGAGGGTTWERATLGLPSIVVVLAENQAPDAVALAQCGAAEIVDLHVPDFDAVFDRAFTGLMRSSDRRRILASKNAALCDGGGGERAADAFLTLLSSRR